MPDTLLQTVYDLGNQMLKALQEDDLASFFGAMEQRTRLIERLESLDLPGDSEPHPMASALAEQQRRLTEAFAEQERRIQNALRDQTRLRQAHRRYHQRPPRRTLLHRNLHG